MRPPILFAALLWLRGFLAEEEACPSLERSAGRESAAPPTVHGLQLHSPGSPSSLEASWGEAPEEQDGYRLLLYHLESQTLAHNISMPPGTLCYNFGDLLPGTLRPPSELLVSSHASTTVVSLAWVSGPLGVHSLGTRRGSQLSECCARWGRCRRPLTAWCCLLMDAAPTLLWVMPLMLLQSLALWRICSASLRPPSWP
ncbi:receptor-type tyrosine-protein phosphatase V-like isoform X3 [Macaca nemestrina]|uniref:receptor-type tyrosine-protein phosphatase V-like isoform X3 n=1 Tax=Macaca nemestrina TaxID=9545 RepID=UPI0039B8C93F